MKRFSALCAAVTAAVLLILPACTPRDTGAEGLAAELARSLSAHTLAEIPLHNPEAASSFDSFMSTLDQYPVLVSPKQIIYELDEAVLPLSWEWQVEGNTWTYETEVELIYEDSQWWVIWEPAALAPGLAPGQLIGVARAVPERGRVLAHDGRAIITPREVYRYGLDKTRIDPAEIDDAARRIAAATGIDPDRFVARANAAGPKAFVEAIAVRPDEVEQWVSADFSAIDGALIVADEALLGPTRTFARELLGRSGEATAEIIEESQGAISAGDIVGLSGLQHQYDESLRGVGAVEIFTVNSSACADPLECDPAERTVIARLDADAPQDLHLSLDIDAQIAAEAALATLEDSDHVPEAALVAIRASTGDVLALANGNGNSGLNHAAVGQYPPGSTFKIITALALLRSGVNADDLVNCPETTVVDGREFKNYDAYPPSQLGEITFEDAIAHSCNTALIELRHRISGGDLLEAAESLGFASNTSAEDLGYPAFLGSLPSPEEGTEFAATLIGQGRVLASPLAMAVVAASVQAGKTVTPVLLDTHRPSAGPEVPLSAAEATILQQFMESVVEYGTASSLPRLPAPALRAKTGTAEHGDTERLPHTWIVGSHGDIAMAVFVGAGIGGAETAGPILIDFFQQLPSLSAQG